MKLCIMYEHRHNLQSYKLQPNIFAYLSLLQTSSFKDILYFLQTPSSSLTYGWNHKSRGKRAASFQVSFSLSLCVVSGTKNVRCTKDCNRNFERESKWRAGVVDTRGQFHRGKVRSSKAICRALYCRIARTGAHLARPG